MSSHHYEDSHVVLFLFAIEVFLAAPGYDSWTEDAAVATGMKAFSGHCNEAGGKTSSHFLDLYAFVAFFVLFPEHFRDALEQWLNLLFSVAMQIHVKWIASLHLFHFFES